MSEDQEVIRYFGKNILVVDSDITRIHKAALKAQQAGGHIKELRDVRKRVRKQKGHDA